METNLPGVFAAGDTVTHQGKLKLITTGQGEAAIAVNFAATYIHPGSKAFPGHSSTMNLWLCWRQPTLHRTPQRIVSLVPSLTEALFAFGLEDSIVGMTDYCTEPPLLVRSKPAMGGTKNPDVQAILHLVPDLVVANVEENRREDVESLQAQGVPVFVCFPRTVIEAIRTVRAFAQVTDAESQASPVLARTRAASTKRLQVHRGTPQGTRLLPDLESSVDDDKP